MSGKYKGQGASGDVLDVTSLGNGLKLVETRKVNFTVKEAEALIGMDEFVGDRPLKDSHVDYLIQSMKRGTFHPELVNIIVCKYDVKTYRMNGQHTAWARIYMEADYSCSVNYLVYTAKSEDDMRTLYASIDRSSPRTRSNVITSYLAGTQEFEGVKSTTIRVVPMGFAMWYWKTKHERHQYDGDDVAFLLRTDQYDLARKVCAFLDKYTSRDYKHIMRAPVVAAIFATFHKAPQIALDFWGPVASGTGIEKVGDPRLKLRNALQVVAVDVGNGSHSDKKTVSQEFMFRQCITAWNAYREGRSLQLLKAVEKGNRPGVK